MDYYYEGKQYILSKNDINDEIMMDKGNKEANLDKTTLMEFLDDSTGNIPKVNGEDNE